MKKLSNDMLAEQQEARRASTDKGSLGDFMLQGGERRHSSANNLPELLDQGPSDKRGIDSVKTRSLKDLMQQ